jgi:hypothetical protein
MYSQLLPNMAAERAGEIRRDAEASSLARRIRPARPGRRGHGAGRRAAGHGSGIRLMPRAAR